MMKYFKRVFSIIILLAFSLRAEAQINLGKSARAVSGISDRTLMVVDDNDPLVTSALRNAIKRKWNVSPFKFCTKSEFQREKGDTSLFFLTVIKEKFRNEEAGMEYLSLLKGGPEDVKDVNGMYEVCSLPLKAGEEEEDYILPFIEAYVKTMQKYVRKIQTDKIAAKLGIMWYSNKLTDLAGKRILINKTDLSSGLSEEYVNERLNGHGKVVDESIIYDCLDNSTPGTLVSICIYPHKDPEGSFCYKMLLCTGNSTLYYYRRQKIKSSRPGGFLKSDIDKISLANKF
ncbi:MAG: hypothetical protein LKI53_04230 [Bacteroidales bacterium]|jgi:hypothetical protein|nr:hypothetical protein [Bacteroidales bacterium]